jgi:hypothetical protein
MLWTNRETHHEWAKEQFAKWSFPCTTCEAVITESFHLLAKVRGGIESLNVALREGLIILDFDARRELAPVLDLMTRYRNVPKSFADACLVRMAKIHGDAIILHDG